MNVRAATPPAKKTRAPVRRVPERMCVACRTRRPQRHLVALVRSPEGLVEIDRTGKKPGRGAYLCPAQECWRTARARRSLDQALAVTVSTEHWRVFEAFMEGLPEARL